MSMSNPNYIAGRAFEYATIKEWEEQGYVAVRTAGSHGPFDVIAFRPDRKPEMVQCKRTSDRATAHRLLQTFRETTIPSKHYHQVMTVKIKGTKSPLSYTV